MPAKGHFTRLTCKHEGATHPRMCSPYCKEHVRTYKPKQRKGQMVMSGPMRIVLELLAAAKQSIPLPPNTNMRTIRCLTVDRDWIVECAPGTYQITKRGRDALKAYAPTGIRRDGICPRCKERPRHVRKSGMVNAYCLECEKDIAVEKKARGRKRVNPNRPCSRCHMKPVHQYPGGEYSTYCEDCGRIVRRESHRKQWKNALERYRQTGELPTCYQCKAAPVMAHPNCLSKYCRTCKNRREADYKLRRVLKRQKISIFTKLPAGKRGLPEVER